MRPESAPVKAVIGANVTSAEVVDDNEIADPGQFVHISVHPQTRRLSGVRGVKATSIGSTGP